ncbi:MAG: GNAT family N-acetyltransferase [Gemmatimonadetes bacterium]|nr:GNAT family N-acetyltransferase [Gemmatimonadota bacterium]
MSVDGVTLEGRSVRLEPLAWSHLDGLTEIGMEPELWRWTTVVVRTPEEMRGYVADALAGRARGTEIPFATLERESGRVVGSTRYLNIEAVHRRVEIGSTWVAPRWQRTAINTEAKLLMLGHAFDALGCIRVELKTDALNAQSRTAIERIGAMEEGVLRRHMITATGRVRDTVYYSVLDEEWPAVRARLQASLDTPRS